MSHFDEAAKGWDEDLMHLDRAVKTHEKITGYLDVKRNWTCLEFGCGTGLLSFRFQPDVGTIDLVDTAEGMIAVVKDKIATLRIGTMHFVDFEAVRTDAAYEGRYDLVYSLMSFHHVDDYESYLGAFNRILKSGGYFCLADLCEEDGSFHAHLPYFAGYTGFDPAVVAAQAETRGFRKEYLGNYYTVIKNGREYPLFLLILRKVTSC